MSTTGNNNYNGTGNNPIPEKESWIERNFRQVRNAIETNGFKLITQAEYTRLTNKYSWLIAWLKSPRLLTAILFAILSYGGILLNGYFNSKVKDLTREIVKEEIKQSSTSSTTSHQK